MTSWGVFAVDRGIWDHPLFSDEPFSPREAWMWLVSAAAWKPIKVGFCGRVVSLDRGEFLFSVRFLATKWRWTKSKVEWFLRKLKTQDMLRAREQDGAIIFNVVNYNEYQRVGLPERDNSQDASQDANGTPTGREQDKEETFKHSNIKKDSSASKARKTLNGHTNDFEQFWAVYPKKIDKGDAIASYLKALKITDAATILAGAQAYARRCETSHTEKKFIRGPARWLNAQSWENETTLTEAPPPDAEALRIQEIEAEYRRTHGEIE